MLNRLEKLSGLVYFSYVISNVHFAESSSWLNFMVDPSSQSHQSCTFIMGIYYHAFENVIKTRFAG